MPRLRLPSFSPASTPIALALLGLLAFGLVVPWLGLFGDDWKYLWAGQILGEPGMQRYFINDTRPVLGLVYQLDINLIGARPWLWHLWGIFWLWACAALTWALARSLWPERSGLAFAAGAFFLLYPGNQVQYSSITIGHLWLVYAFFLGSLWLSVEAMRCPRRYFVYSALAVLLAAFQMVALEYFLMLELVRPLLLWIACGQMGKRGRSRLQAAFKAWLPYALLFFFIVYWRMFLFPLTNRNFRFTMLAELQTSPLPGLLKLGGIVLGDVFWQTTARPWFLALAEPLRQGLGSLSAMLTPALALLAAGLAFFFQARLRSGGASEPGKQRWGARQAALIGLLALLPAGLPFWTTGLVVTTSGVNSRYAMPFIFGAAFLLTGLLELLPFRRGRWALTALLVGCAAAAQFQTGQDFRRDWLVEKEMAWQLAWRMPGLAPGTMLLTNDLPLRYYGESSLSAQLNWVAAKGEPGYRADYALRFASSAKQAGMPLDRKGVPVQRDLTSIDFYGSTSRVVAFQYLPGACLRLLDPRFDPYNPLLRDELQDAARLSDASLIQPAGSSFALPPQIFGAEPGGGMCRLYQQVALAAQQGDWSQAFEIGHRINLTPVALERDPLLALVLIESSAHTGDFPTALEFTRQASQADRRINPVLCRVWDALEADLTCQNLPAAFDTARKELECQRP